MVRLETLGEGAIRREAVLSGIWHDFESSSDERVRVNFNNGSASSTSGRVKASSIKPLHEGNLEEGSGERGSGTFNAMHCGVLKRGRGLRALLAERREGSEDLIEEAPWTGSYCQCCRHRPDCFLRMWAVKMISVLMEGNDGDQLTEQRLEIS